MVIVSTSELNKLHALHSMAIEGAYGAIYNAIY